MAEYTEEETAIIVRYLVATAKYRIGRARAGVVDRIAREAFYALEELGANTQAEEVYGYYLELWE